MGQTFDCKADRDVNAAVWEQCTDVALMAELVTSAWHKVPSGCRRATDRQMRLFACAVIRRVWHILSDQYWKDAIIASEQESNGDDSPELDAMIIRGKEGRDEWGQKLLAHELTTIDRMQWNDADAVAILCDDISPGWPVSGRNLLNAVQRALEFEAGVSPTSADDPVNLPEDIQDTCKLNRLCHL